MALPILDLSPFLGPSSVPAKRAAAAALDDACRTHGFFYLTAHGIPAQLEQHVLAQARKFFCPSSSSSSSSNPPPPPAASGEQQQQRKQQLARRDPGLGGDGARGYQRLGENVTQGASDHHEAIDFYRPVIPPVPFDPTDAAKGWKLLQGPNLWPAADPEFRTAFEDFWARLLELGHAVMVAMAWALGYQDPADEDALLRHTRNGFWVARAIGYPPLAAAHEADGGLSCGAHTDYGCTTFLLADDTPGALQVLSKAGQWINADPIPGLCCPPCLPIISEANGGHRMLCGQHWRHDGSVDERAVGQHAAPRRAPRARRPPWLPRQRALLLRARLGRRGAPAGQVRAALRRRAPVCAHRVRRASGREGAGELLRRFRAARIAAPMWPVPIVFQSICNLEKSTHWQLIARAGAIALCFCVLRPSEMV